MCAHEQTQHKVNRVVQIIAKTTQFVKQANWKYNTHVSTSKIWEEILSVFVFVLTRAENIKNVQF